MDNYNIEGGSAEYIASVYFMTATMTTVGYGDIVPFTNIEKFFDIWVILISSCVSAYVINSIGSIFVQMDQNEKNVDSKMALTGEVLN